MLLLPTPALAQEPCAAELAAANSAEAAYNQQVAVLPNVVTQPGINRFAVGAIVGNAEEARERYLMARERYESCASGLDEDEDHR